MRYNRLKKFLPFIFIFFLLVATVYIAIWNKVANAAQHFQQEQILQDETISSGIEYTQKKVRNFGNNANMTQYINILKVDATNPAVSIVTSKALDAIVAREPLINQAKQEQVHGRDVVAGINADMFNMQTGVNNGLQVKNGNLLINHSYSDQVKLFPAFGVDSKKQVFIDTLSMEGQITSNGTTIQVDSLNRNENANDKIAIYTQKLNANSTLTFDDKNGVFTKNGAIAVISDIQNPNELKAGQTYSGRVSTVYTSTPQGIQIPPNAVIVAGFGSKADWIRNNVKQGQAISFTFNLYKGADRTLTNDVVEATGSYNWLVHDNHALSEEEMLSMGYDKQLVATRNARTAIGITADHKVIAVTVDKIYVEGMGVTLPELAGMLRDAGAVQAIGLDGGGSTEMIVRQKNDFLTVNHPEGGYSSPVTNGLLFVHTSP